MSTDLKALKDSIRKEKIAARKAAKIDQIRIKSEKICKKIIDSKFYQEAEVIMIYKAVNGEVMLDVLEKDAISQNKKICYPLCIDKTVMKALAPNDENAFVSGSFGIKEPDMNNSKEISPGDIDLVIAPCTAFDEKCRRIGMGAGYYDRYLPKCEKAYIAAAAYEYQKVKRVPADEFDKTLDAVVSEEKVYYSAR